MASLVIARSKATTQSVLKYDLCPPWIAWSALRPPRDGELWLAINEIGE
jgi:hypothetical protein